MPLLGKKSYKPNPLPKDLKSEEEVFVIKETNEVFRKYDEYVNRIILYGFQVWSCQLTGKTKLKYGEAIASEEQALKRLESFPKYFEKTVLQIVHHSSCELQTLVQQCYKKLEKEYVENEPVECRISGKWHQGKISRIHHRTISENDIEARYDIECDGVQDRLKDVSPGDIKRRKKLPSEEMLKCFIRANTENPWRNDNSPWMVKTDMAKKYSLLEKLDDFSLALSKKTTPSSKVPTKQNKSSEKQKKRAMEESTGHGKPRVNKTDLSQRKLDSFRKSVDNSFTAKDGIIASLSKKSLNKVTPVKKDTVDICSSPESNDDKTPSGQLRGTPVKCRLVLTPVKSPYRGTAKSPAQKTSGVNGGNKTKKNVVIELDNTDDLTIAGSKSPKTKASNSGKKLKSSSKSDKAMKTLEDTKELTEKPVKKATASKKLDLLKSEATGNSIVEKKLMKGAESKKKTKILKPEALVQKGESVNVDSDSDKDFESSPETQLAVKVKQSSTGKMKQTTLLDLAKKPEVEKAVAGSPKMKAKKQKTLSEMFSAALQKDKPRALNDLIRKTAQQVSSPSSLALELSTPHRDFVTEKWHAYKERGHFGFHEDNELANSKPLPPAKSVNMPTGITAETFGDIAMIADFVHSFRELLVPRETLHISIDDLSQALVTSNEGFPLLSRILVIFLQILLQDSSTKGKELGMLLSEMPLTQQTASEVSRLYLNSKLKMLTAFEEEKQLQGILKSLQHEELYNLSPEDKTKILVTLCHEVLSSDAFDDYTGRQRNQATQLRKQKIAKQKERNDKIREEKERQKKEREEMEKHKQEEASKKQLKMDELNKKETTTDCTNSETIIVSPGTQTSNKTEEKKPAKEKKEVTTKEQSEDVSEVVKTTRKRREDMAAKHSGIVDETKLKEEQKRLEKEEEEQWNINMAQCQYALRLKPIGCDRNHARYWVFNGVAAGVYVEQGWRNLEDLSRTAEEASKESKEDGGMEEASVETDHKQTAHENDSAIEIVEETKDENKMDSCEKDTVHKYRLPDISYEWSCYSTVEEVEALLDCLSWQGIRENALKKSLKEQLTTIIDGIARRNSSRKATKPETGEEGLFSSIKEELKDTAERLVYGNLAVLDEGLERYQETVDEASTISDLASQLEKLLPAVLPQFFQGAFTKDKKGSEEAKQCWMNAVKQATTVSRVHLLLGLLDSTIIWDLSAENARCKICRLKGIGTTLILCDDCNLGYHLQCLRPALSKVPEGHWSCPACKPNERQSSRTNMKSYKEESGSEMEDEGEEASEASIDNSDDSSDSEDESDEHEDYCHTCGEDGDLICCDTCPLVFHKDCHQPPLRTIPRGAWSCWHCRQPKNKKQMKNARGNKTTMSKGAKKKAEKLKKRHTLKRPHSRSSEESGNETVSKRTRQSRQPIEITDEKSARDRRKKARARIEDISDEESNDDKMKTSKSKQRGRNQKVFKNGRASSRLQRTGRQDSDDEKEERNAEKTNVKSFYGKPTRRTRQQKVSSGDDDDDDDDEDEPAKRRTNASRKPERGSRRNRPQILDDSEDEFDDEEESGKENHRSSRRKIGSRSKSSEKPARRSTRNQRHAPSSPEESAEDSDEDIPQVKNKRAASKTNNKRSKNVSSSSEESDESGHNTSTRQALRNTCHEDNKSNKGTARRKAQGRRGDKIHEDESEDGKVKSKSKRNGKEGKGKKSEFKNSINRPGADCLKVVCHDISSQLQTEGNHKMAVDYGSKTPKSSTSKEGHKETRKTRKTVVLQEETKRRRVNVDMDACEQVIKDLLLHEDSWPFTQAVNLREVPDYLELVTTPMDLGTVKENLKSLEYPDVDSFVADVRLVFTNSDKYNLSTSDVGQAGKSMEKYFDKLFKENFSNTDKKSKVQRKR